MTPIHFTRVRLGERRGGGAGGRGVALWAGACQMALMTLAALVLLGGCASVPLATALRFSGMTGQSLAAVDPAVLRVRVSMLSGFELDVAATRLRLAVTGPNGATRSAAFGVALIAQTQEKRSAGWFSSAVAVATYEMALTPDGVRQLREMQRFALANEPNETGFSALVSVAKSPPNATENTLWVDLKLYAKEPFVSLLDGAKLKFSP